MTVVIVADNVSKYAFTYDINKITYNGSITYMNGSYYNNTNSWQVGLSVNWSTGVVSVGSCMYVTTAKNYTFTVDLY